MPISDTVFRPNAAIILSTNPVEAHAASDCTGADGTANRVLTTTKNLYASSLVVVDGLVMKRTTQISITNNDITFLDILFDTSQIEVY